MSPTRHGPRSLEEVFRSSPHSRERSLRWLRSARAITQIHQTGGLDRTALEAEVFSHQLSAWFDPPRPGDRILGRVKTSPLGVSPEPGGMGYYCCERSIASLHHQNVLEEAEKIEWKNILEYWKERTTQHAILHSPPEKCFPALQVGHWDEQAGSAFGLIRLAGCQWSHHELLREGLSGLQKKIQSKLAAGSNHQKRLTAWNQILQSFRNLFYRFKAEATTLSLECVGKDRVLAEAMAKDADQLAEGKPNSFSQALQLIWIVDAGVGCLNHGRLDDDLVPFWNPGHDEEYVQLLTELWQRIEERKTVFNGRVIVGGNGRKSPEVADRIAHLCLEATSRHDGIEPQLSLRISEHQDASLLSHAFEALEKGRTYPILYWDKNVVPSYGQALKLTEEKIQHWVPYGCGEFVILGESIGTPNGIANAARLLEEVIFDLPLGSTNLPESNRGRDYPDMPALWNAFERRVQQTMSALAHWQIHTYTCTQNQTELLPLSLMMEGAIEKELALFDAEGHHQGGTMELYGMVDAADSLLAIEKIVFEMKLISWSDLREALLDNFKGHETLLARLKRLTNYGNEYAPADEWVRKVHETFCRHTMTEGKIAGLDSFLVVVINNWVNTAMGRYTGALPCGRKKGTALANANGPRPGQDQKGPSALLSSMACLKSGIDAGTVQNLKLSPEWFENEANDLKALLKQYELQGGTQLMVTVSRPEELRKAMEHPEDYAHLMVRVGGFSARFVDLPRDCQMEIMERTLH